MSSVTPQRNPQGFLPDVPTTPDQETQNFLYQLKAAVEQLYVDPTPPAGITGLTVTTNNIGNEIQWNASANAASYNVFRNTTASFTTATLIDQLPGNSNISAFDPNVQGVGSGTRFYWVQPLTASGVAGPLSAYVSAANAGTISITATVGFSYIVSVAGKPSNVPATVAGATAIAYDTSGNNLWAYNLVAGTWVAVNVTPFNYQSFTSASGTWTMPVGWSSAICRVVMTAGGGGGGGGSGSAGGGGGSGEIVDRTVTVSTNQAITVGAAGASVASGTGGNGGNSTFGSLLTARGGQGGTTASGGTFTNIVGLGNPTLTAPPSTPFGTFAAGGNPGGKGGGVIIGSGFNGGTGAGGASDGGGGAGGLYGAGGNGGVNAGSANGVAASANTGAGGGGNSGAGNSSGAGGTGFVEVYASQTS